MEIFGILFNGLDMVFAISTLIGVTLFILRSDAGLAMTAGISVRTAALIWTPIMVRGWRSSRSRE